MTPTSYLTASPAPVVTIAGTDAPAISFVTVTYGTGPIVIDMIRTLVATVTVPHEVIVVDNPHPSTGALTRRHLLLDTSGVRVITPDTNLGFGGGCEWGAWHASGEIIAFVNPDLEFLPGWIEPLLDVLDDAATSIAAAVLLEPDGRVQEAGGSIDARGWTTPRTDVGADSSTEVDYASAACWLVRADEHERLGGFDPAFHPAYFEDVDLALRARRLGGRCVVDGRSRVIHHRGRSTPDNPVSDHQHEVFVERWPLVAWRA